MINNGKGNPIPPLEEKRKKRSKDDSKAVERQLRLLKEMKDFGEAIRMNLLEKSGLSDNRILRDLNILEESIREASRHLNADELRPALDRHFGLDNLKESDLHKQADGCTIAALLMMNAAMLHQRIANGRWLSRRERPGSGQERRERGAPDQPGMELISGAVTFYPVLEPALERHPSH